MFLSLFLIHGWEAEPVLNLYRNFFLSFKNTKMSPKSVADIIIIFDIVYIQQQ